MGPPVLKLPSASEWLVFAAILGGLFLVVVPAVQTVRNPKGPYGRLIPTAGPEEANRIVHATGISIVAPKNWDPIRALGPDVPHFCVAARGAPAARLKSFITIRKTERPSEAILSSHSRVSFQSHPAYERMGTDHASFDDPSSSYSLYVDATGQWWHITWIVADVVRELPPRIKTYIDTVRFPDASTSSEPDDATELPIGSELHG